MPGEPDPEDLGDEGFEVLGGEAPSIRQESGLPTARGGDSPDPDSGGEFDLFGGRTYGENVCPGDTVGKMGLEEGVDAKGGGGVLDAADEVVTEGVEATLPADDAFKRPR